MIEMAEAVRVGMLATQSKQGVRTYDAWKHQALQSLDTTNAKVLTVFEKLKQARKGATLFDRLRKKHKKEST